MENRLQRCERGGFVGCPLEHLFDTDDRENKPSAAKARQELSSRSLLAVRGLTFESDEKRRVQQHRAAHGFARPKPRPLPASALDPVDQILTGFDRSGAIDQRPNDVGLGNLALTRPARQPRGSLFIKLDSYRRHGNTLILPRGVARRYLTGRRARRCWRRANGSTLRAGRVAASAPGDSVTPSHEAIVGAIWVMRTTPRLPAFGTSGPRITSDAWSSGRVGANPWPPFDVALVSNTSWPEPE